MKTLAELQAIRDKARMQVGLRSEGGAELRVQVGRATCGIAAGARPVLNAFGGGSCQARSAKCYDHANRLHRYLPV